VDAAAVKRIVTLPGISRRLPVSATAGSNSRPVWCRRKGDAQRRRERHEAEDRDDVHTDRLNACGFCGQHPAATLAGPDQSRVDSDPTNVG